MLAIVFARRAAKSLQMKVTASHLVYFCAVAILVTGLLALVSWVEGWPALLRSRTAILYVDTAVLLCLAGAGLLAAMRQNYTATRLMGTFLAVIANLLFAAGLAGTSVSLHNVFPELTRRIASPEQASHIQMAPATAASFFLSGCALALLSRRRSNHVLAVKAAIGVTIGVIGLTGICGQFQTVAAASSSNAISSMDALTATCILLIGIGICALCSLHSQCVSEELSPPSIVIGVIGLILIFGATDAATVVKTHAALLSDSGIEGTYSKERAVRKTVDCLRKAETSKRGFLLTRADKFLASYLLDIAALRAALSSDELRTIPDWQQRNLHNLITTRMGQLDTTIELERLGRHTEAVELIRSGTGPALSEEIERDAQSVTNDLELQAVSRKAERQILMRNLMNLVLLSYGIAVVMVAVTVLLARFEARQHQRESLKLASTLISEPVENAPQETTAEPAHLRVLLIDDNEDMKLLVAHAFEKHGGGRYRLSWARCLKDGFRELTRGGIDLVLLDLGLPETSGYQLCVCAGLRAGSARPGHHGR